MQGPGEVGAESGRAWLCEEQGEVGGPVAFACGALAACAGFPRMNGRLPEQ